MSKMTMGFLRAFYPDPALDELREMIQARLPDSQVVQLGQGVWWLRSNRQQSTHAELPDLEGLSLQEAFDLLWNKSDRHIGIAAASKKLASRT